jgi:hypothetical protein
LSASTVIVRSPRLGVEVLDVCVDAELRQAAHGCTAGFVVAERREELTPPCEQRELSRDHGASARGLAPDFSGMDDRARLRPARNPGEFHPFDMPDDGASHSPAPCHVSVDDGGRAE